MYACFYLCEFIYTTSVPVQVKEGTGAPVSGDLDGYEPHDLGAGNHTGFSARTTGTLNHWAITAPVPSLSFMSHSYIPK